MTEDERQEARRSFESWSALTLEMIDDGSLPGRADHQQRVRALLAGPDRDLAWAVFLAGFMSVEVD